MPEKQFDFDAISFDDIFEKTPSENSKIEADDKKSVQCLKRTVKNIYRRAFSEIQLLDVAGIDFNEGESYHFITGGDVDALSYLKLILIQQNLDYCMFSTWCMAMDDVLHFRGWIGKGKIKKLDAFVGEIFPGTYSAEYSELKDICEATGGKIVVARNHSKIFAGYGSKFHFGIETSKRKHESPD